MDIHAELRAISARHRSRRAWRKRRAAIVAACKLAGVITLCLAAMPVAVGLGVVLGEALAP